MRNPRDMGSAEIQALLQMLAIERRVSVSTHNQALSALLLLYREVMGQSLLPTTPTKPKRQPQTPEPKAIR